MLPRRLLPLTALLLGCAASPASSPPTLVVALTPPPPPPLAASPAPEPPPPPAHPDLHPPLAVPAEVACRLSTKRWNDGALGLRFRAGSAPFAQVYSGIDPTFSLPIGAPTQGAFMTVDAGGVILFGVVEAVQIPLRPQRAKAVEGFLVPLSSARLDWSGGAKNALTVTLPPVERLRTVAPKISFEAGCDEVTLSSSSFDALPVAGGKGLGKSAKLKTNAPIPLSLVPGGPKVADIELAKDDKETVTVTAVKGGASRVLWWTDDALVFGWVPSASLIPLKNEAGDLSGYGGLGLSGVGEGSHGTLITCPATVPLAVDFEGERRTIGAITPGTKFWTEGLKDGFFRAEVVGGAFIVEDKASLLVRAIDLAKCAPVASARP